MFSLGGKWFSKSTNVQFTDNKHIYVSDDGHITFGTDECIFNSHTLPQGSLEECNAELGINKEPEYAVEQEKEAPQTSDIISTEELTAAAKELGMVFEINSKGITVFDRNDKEYSLNSREDFLSLIDAMMVLKILRMP